MLPYFADCVQFYSRFCLCLQDAYRSTTSVAVRKARLGEIKHEMFTSEKLKVIWSYTNIS